MGYDAVSVCACAVFNIDPLCIVPPPPVSMSTDLKPWIFLYQGLLWDPSLIFCTWVSSSGVQNLGRNLSYDTSTVDLGDTPTLRAYRSSWTGSAYPTSSSSSSESSYICRRRLSVGRGWWWSTLTEPIWGWGEHIGVIGPLLLLERERKGDQPIVWMERVYQEVHTSNQKAEQGVYGVGTSLGKWHTISNESTQG